MGNEKKEGRFRDFCFTINNYSASDIAILDNIKCDYLIYGKEVGEKGTPHLQCYIYIHNKISFNALKKIVHRAHIEPCEGSTKQNIIYCKKGEQSKAEFKQYQEFGPNYGKNADYVERGQVPQQGKRTDIELMRELVKETGQLREVVKVAKSYQSFKMAQLYLEYHEEVRDWIPAVYWYYGQSGFGKSRTAKQRGKELEEIHGKAYFQGMKKAKWFPGYDAHKTVIIDEVRKTFCSFDEMLAITGPDPYIVETKGGSRQFLARTIIITSPFHPEDLYDAVAEDMYQLIRRIKEIKLFGEYKEKLLQNEFSEL